MVFTPVLRLEPETVRAIFDMEMDGPATVVLQRDNPTGDGHQDHLHQYQRGRKLFLSGGYDAMLVIESDIIPPPETLKRLAALPADVAYGCYLLRSTEIVNIQERYYAGTGKKARNLGESLTARGLYDAAVKHGIIECSGGGLGCILIHRHVLEAVPFEAAAEDVFFDYGWTESVFRAGYKMMADMAVQCGHVKTDGQVLKPSPRKKRDAR